MVPGGSRLVPARFRAVPGGFRLVPARFRAVPAGSGRFRVGSAFYIHPSVRANFFHAVLLVALVLLCDSVALKCGKANQTSRKCAGKIYFLSKELARAAELQEGSAICRVHWDEIRRSNNRCSVPRENHSRGLRKQRIPARLFAVLDAIGATCHVMSCQNGLWNFYYLVPSISIFTVYSLPKKWF